MARMTKAEREAIEEAEFVERAKTRADEVRANWHRRVALVLLALRNEHDIDVQTLKDVEDADLTWLQFKDNTRRFWCTPFFPLDLLDRFDDSLILSHEIQLERAEELVEYLKREKAEALRKATLRNVALNKLTDEEREVLGLN